MTLNEEAGRARVMNERNERNAFRDSSCEFVDHVHSANETIHEITRIHTKETNRSAALDRQVLAFLRFSFRSHAALVTCLNADTNVSISPCLPMVTRMWFGRLGNGRPTCTPRWFKASITGRTGRFISIIIKFACEGMCR